MSTLLLYVVIQILNVLGMIMAFYLFHDDKPIGKLFYKHWDKTWKALLIYLLFSIPFGLFSCRFIYFCCLILLELL